MVIRILSIKFGIYYYYYLDIYILNKTKELFYSSLGNFTDDYFEALENSRNEMLPDEERELFV